MTNPMTITFITGNSGKVASMRSHLKGLGITVEQQELTLIEPQATTAEEIALSKARQAFEMIRLVSESKKLYTYDYV